MDLTTINGLPAHALLVHAVVVLVPLAALLVAMAAVWPAARRRLGVITPIVALVALGTVPLATQAGEWLERHVEPDPLVTAHAHLGDGLLPWAIGLFVLGAALWALPRWRDRANLSADSAEGEPARWTRPVLVVLAVLAVVTAVGTVVQVYRIGDSGAKAVWHDGYTADPTSGRGNG
jgi:hypothetical protein